MTRKEPFVFQNVPKSNILGRNVNKLLSLMLELLK